MEITIAIMAIFCTFIVFGSLAVVLMTRARSRETRARIQAEVQTKLIDRFGSAPELADFLQSPAGRNFMGQLESAPRLHAREKILVGIRRAIIVTAVGVAFCGLGGVFHEEGLLIPGFFLLALGGGYLISALVSMRLSRAWGLFEENQKSNGDLTATNQ